MSADKVWFITGCSSGFGCEIAKAALRSGAKVAVTARKMVDIEAFKKEFGENAITLSLDITNNDQIQKCVEETKKTFGRIDVLVNNAGYALLGAIEEIPEEEARKLFDTNFFGLLNVTRAVLPIMRKQKSGHIINMSSAGGLVALGGLGMYNATKFAVEGLTEALAQEVEPLGIKVTSIEPGPFRTDFIRRSIKQFSGISDYDDTRGLLTNVVELYHGNQPGDPEKAASVIVELANNPVPPLHLLMGKIALERVREKMLHLSEQINAWEKITISTDYEK